EHDDRKRRLLRMDALQYFHTVNAGHDKVEDDEGYFGTARAFEIGKGGLTAFYRDCAVAVAIDDFLQNPPLGGVIIHNQNGLGHNYLSSVHRAGGGKRNEGLLHIVWPNMGRIGKRRLNPRPDN